MCQALEELMADELEAMRKSGWEAGRETWLGGLAKSMETRKESSALPNSPEFYCGKTSRNSFSEHLKMKNTVKNFSKNITSEYKIGDKNRGMIRTITPLLKF